jgi:hypothetical protein
MVPPKGITGADVVPAFVLGNVHTNVRRFSVIGTYPDHLQTRWVGHASLLRSNEAPGYGDMVQVYHMSHRWTLLSRPKTTVS